MALGQLFHVDPERKTQPLGIGPGPSIAPDPAGLLDGPVTGRALVPVEDPAFGGIGDVGPKPTDELRVGFVG